MKMHTKVIIMGYPYHRNNVRNIEPRTELQKRLVSNDNYWTGKTFQDLKENKCQSLPPQSKGSEQSLTQSPAIEKDYSITGDEITDFFMESMVLKSKISEDN